MSAIACNEAKADYVALAEAIDNGLDAGLTVSQVKEALSHLYAYTGFPRSLNALGTLQKVLEQRQSEGKATEEGIEASPLPSNYNALAQGTEVQTKVSGRAFDYAFSPAEDYYLKAEFYRFLYSVGVIPVSRLKKRAKAPCSSKPRAKAMSPMGSVPPRSNTLACKTRRRLSHCITVWPLYSLMTADRRLGERQSWLA